MNMCAARCFVKKFRLLLVFQFEHIVFYYRFCERLGECVSVCVFLIYYQVSVLKKKKPPF